MGLYGTIVVEPADPGYWPAVDRQLTLTLDDLLVEDGQIAPFRRSGPTFVAMGRYGNVMLINGETQFSGQAAAGEVVRLYVVNTANTRIFNFAIRGARAKLVGGDSGRYEHETFTDEVLLAPSERAVMDVLFDTRSGNARTPHPDHTYDLGAFTVTQGAASDAGRSSSSRVADVTRSCIGSRGGRRQCRSAPLMPAASRSRRGTPRRPLDVADRHPSAVIGAGPVYLAASLAAPWVTVKAPRS